LIPHNGAGLRDARALVGGGYVAQSHLAPSLENLQILQHYRLKTVLHLRDPRQALLSWVHHIARRRRVDLTALHQAEWIMPGPDSWAHHVMSEAFHARGLAMPRIAIRSLSGHLQANLPTNGDFVTVVARSVFNFYRGRFALKALPIKLPAPPWPVAIVTLKNRTLSPVAERFIECVRKATTPMKAKSRV
jgi:DNA-binding transcriptional LysR family regulator